MDREKITLAGAQETMLATLYGKALDSRSPNSILRDHEADNAIQRIDYDFRKTGVKGTTAAGVALRAKQLDDWTAEFLPDHPQATVLHLACGLDTRVQRLNPRSSVRWLDVDYPEVLELRERLLPAPAGDYRMIGASVTDDAWLDTLPDDRPTVAVFEGLSDDKSTRPRQAQHHGGVNVLACRGAHSPLCTHMPMSVRLGKQPRGFDVSRAATTALLAPNWARWAPAV